MTFSARARRYAEAVVSGEILACRLVRLACERHLADLGRESDADFPFRFDAAAADRVCRFIELLPHIKGSWALRKEKIRLQDWQCFVVCVPFGWKQKADGLRRFRRVYIEVPRKAGKSSLTAALGLYMLAADGEHGAEVYSGAGSEKQALEVFGPARLMARNTPELCADLGIQVNASNLSVLDTASKFEPIIGKPGDGASPSFSITDEYHEHATSEQYDTMVTGMGAREQPMAWVITTAGSDTAGPCYALRGEVVDVLEGSVQNDRLFGLVYSVDEGTEWTSEAALRTANPNYGVSVFADYLKAQQTDAINSPRKQATFKTKHLNIWVTASAPFFNLEKWNRLADAPPIEEFHGEPCWLGLDLASKLDIAAKVKVFRREIAEEAHFYAFGQFYIPAERAEEPELTHYAGWGKQGHVVLTPGNLTDYDAIEDDILADAEAHRIVQVGFDPWNSSQIITHLQNEGVTCVEVGQTVKHLSEPMKWVEALIVSGRLHHDGNPAFAWQISNVTAQVDRNDNVYPRKERPEKKIDGGVALIIAMGRALDGPAPAPTYDLIFLGG